MNPALWIALAATLLVLVAHLGLFWWFLVRPKNGGDNDGPGDPPFR